MTNFIRKDNLKIRIYEVPYTHSNKQVYAFYKQRIIYRTISCCRSDKKKKMPGNVQYSKKAATQRLSIVEVTAICHNFCKGDFILSYYSKAQPAHRPWLPGCYHGRLRQYDLCPTSPPVLLHIE